MTTPNTTVDVGDEVPEMEWTPDADFVKKMMSLSGWLARGEAPSTNRMMSEPNRFTDEGAARSEGFRNLIVPGNLGMMAMATAVEQWLPTAYIRKLDCVFRQPLNQGQTVKASGVVTDRQEEDGKTILEMDVYLVREDGQRPQGGTAVVVIPAPDGSAAR